MDTRQRQLFRVGIIRPTCRRLKMTNKQMGCSLQLHMEHENAVPDLQSSFLSLNAALCRHSRKLVSCLGRVAFPLLYRRTKPNAALTIIHNKN